METKDSWAIKPDKNKHEYVIGIDLGHGETSAAYCPIAWDAQAGELSNYPVTDISFPGNLKVVASAITIMEDGTAFIGENAFDPEKLKKAKVNVCFKKCPKDINGEAEQLMIRFMHEVYVLIREKNPALFTDSNHVVFIATPSGWSQEDRNLYGQMARLAGIPIAGVTAESRAAFIRGQLKVDSGLPQYIDKGAIVFDMGSSTLDFTYLRGNEITDFGYNCGASLVERIIYSAAREKDEVIKDFERAYPSLIDRLLFAARTAKEQVYFHPEKKNTMVVHIDELVEDDEFDGERIKMVFEPGALNAMLDKEGYIQQIKESMIDFKNNHIAGKPIYVVFLTGGASRMDFIRSLVSECWNIENDMIYMDQEPSLTISQGVAEVARGDLRSGDIKDVKDLVSGIDVYTPFIDRLCEKVSSEMIQTVNDNVVAFRDSEYDSSVNDLQDAIDSVIAQDINNITGWAKDIYKEEFESATEEIRERVGRMASNYSRRSFELKRTDVNFAEIPEIDLSSVSQQLQGVSSSLVDTDSLLKNIGIGALIAVAFGLIGVAGYGIYKWLTNETEEEKLEKAKAKDLNSELRQEVFVKFSDNWSQIESQIKTSVNNALRSNQELKRMVGNETKNSIRNYANECFNQARLMVEL